MKVKVSSSLEQMKNLEVGQLGIMTTWNTRINLVVFLGFNDRTMNGYKFVAKTHRLAYGMKATFL